LTLLESTLSSPDETFALELATFSYRHLPETRHLKLLALQPGEALGQAAARLLIKRLSGARKTQHIIVPVEILELGSSKQMRHEQAERKEA
jgi:DNA-binding LacI/PurR family transcriptional regulator